MNNVKFYIVIVLYMDTATGTIVTNIITMYNRQLVSLPIGNYDNQCYSTDQKQHTPKPTDELTKTAARLYMYCRQTKLYY